MLLATLLLKMGHACQVVRHMVATKESYTVVLHQNSFVTEGSVPVSLDKGSNKEVNVTLEFCFYEGRYGVLQN